MMSGSVRAVSVGVLGFQGGVAEHLALFRSIPGVMVLTVRRASDLEGIDAIVLPGGESTAIGTLLADFGLLEPLRERIIAGMPAWGTCAGMILLAKGISNDSRRHLALMDIDVDRNGYGRQSGSFTDAARIEGLGEESFPLAFIRAPRIVRVGPGVRVLASCRGEAVACRQGNMVATAFHPELTSDRRFHEWFAGLAKAAIGGSAEG